MPALLPDSDTAVLRAALADTTRDRIVVCYCAAWCDTCSAYRVKFDALADARPNTLFIWVDIEDHAEWLGEEDVENFPTLSVRHGDRHVFFGPMLPHIGHLERLLDSLNAESAAVPTKLPDWARLQAA